VIPLRRQRGSITPVWLALVLGTLLLFIVLVDREWVAYQLNKVEQTADFAAEAGASLAQITYPLKVYGVRQHWEDQTTCEPPVQPSDPPLCTTTSLYQPRAEDHDDCEGDLKALQGKAWQTACHCDQAIYEGAWTCLRAALRDKPQVRFLDNLDDVVFNTFQANWTDHPGGRVSLPFPVYPDTEQRSVYLQVQFFVSSPFGGDRWLGRSTLIDGKAVVQIPPLTLN
jgi:hypothetical protein